MKLGLSLSFCIRDIAEGRVPIEEVHHITTGCSPRHEQDVESILDSYSKSYWRNCEAKAREVFAQLRSEHKISWLSSFDNNPMVIGTTTWLELPSSFD